jgi:hypothetical protein
MARNFLFSQKKMEELLENISGIVAAVYVSVCVWAGPKKSQSQRQSSFFLSGGFWER